MKYPRLIAAALALSAVLSAATQAKDEFPPANKVFRYALESDGTTLTIYWDVLPGYYLYKEQMGVTSATPGVKLGVPRYPKGEIHHDEYFGDQEIFRDDFKIIVPLMQAAGRKAGEVNFMLKLQGCADAGLCYPPTVWDAKLIVPPRAVRTVSRVSQ